MPLRAWGLIAAIYSIYDVGWTMTGLGSDPTCHGHRDHPPGLALIVDEVPQFPTLLEVMPIVAIGVSTT